MKLVHGTLGVMFMGLILVCLQPTQATGQTPIDSVQQLYYSRYDFQNKSLIQVFKDHLRLSNPKTGQGKTLKAPGAGPLTLEFEPFLLKNTLWFVKRGSGLVYTLRNDSIVRVDRSFDHRMQTDAAEFVRNDTIFRHGGYGLWAAVKHITFFHPNTLEWEVERPLNSSDFPSGMYRHQVVTLDNEAWFFSGQTPHPTDPMASEINTQVWRYHFNRLEWEPMGNINPAVNQFDPALTARVDTDQPGQFIIFPVKNQIVAVNLLNNTATFHHQPKENLHLYYVPHYAPFILEGRVYYYRLLSNVPKKYAVSPFYDLEFCSAPAEAFTGEQISVQPFYEKPLSRSIWFPAASLILVSSLGLLAVLVFRRKRKTAASKTLRVTPEGLLLGTTLHRLEEKSLAVLNKLLETEGDVYSADIMEMVQNTNLDFSHNTRIKNQLISSLNLEIKTLLGEREDVIQTVRSPIDRRIKTYRIRKQLFETK